MLASQLAEPRFELGVGRARCDALRRGAISGERGHSEADRSGGNTSDESSARDSGGSVVEHVTLQR
jgi:hypothetical protein